MIGFLNGNGELINAEVSKEECKEFLRGYVSEDVLEDVDVFVYGIVNDIIHTAIENVDYDLSVYTWGDLFDDLKHTFEYVDVIQSIEREFGIVFSDEDIPVVEDMIAVYARAIYFRHVEKLSI